MNLLYNDTMLMKQRLCTRFYKQNACFNFKETNHVFNTRAK